MTVGAHDRLLVQAESDGGQKFKLFPHKPFSSTVGNRTGPCGQGPYPLRFPPLNTFDLLEHPDRHWGVVDSLSCLFVLYVLYTKSGSRNSFVLVVLLIHIYLSLNNIL